MFYIFFEVVVSTNEASYNVGDNISLKCNVTGGDPTQKKKVTWTKNNQEFEFGSLNSLPHSRILENELQIKSLLTEGEIRSFLN